jgi:hypothetical protein
VSRRIRLPKLYGARLIVRVPAARVGQEANAVARAVYRATGLYIDVCGASAAHAPDNTEMGADKKCMPDPIWPSLSPTGSESLGSAQPVLSAGVKPNQMRVSVLLAISKQDKNELTCRIVLRLGRINMDCYCNLLPQVFVAV